jgi:hypothetical protein
MRASHGGSESEQPQLTALRRKIGSLPASQPTQLLVRLCLLVVFALTARSRLEAQSRVDEYHLKAAFLFHFTEMVEWPASVLGDGAQPIWLCTLGEDPFDGELEAAVAGKLATRPLRVRHLNDAQDFPGCHLIFIASSERIRTPLLLTKLKNAPVLTVGETEEFVKQGGMIGLCLDGKKVRLEINLDASRRAELKISSRLLLLAKTVIGGRP